jgi:hypothetical protein
VATPGREVFDLFDEPLTLTAMGSARSPKAEPSSGTMMR